MDNIARSIIYAGVILVIIGVIWQFGGKYLPIGRLPGDIVINKPNFKFYFPLATSIILSIILSIVLWLISFLKK